MARVGALLLAIAAAAAAAGCSGKTTPRAPERSTIGGDLLDPGAGPDDVIVATVDGRPVWGSCVAGHVRARGVDRDQALNDCIALELLAKAALDRGVLADSDTQTELRAALVDGFVTDEFEAKITGPADLPRALVDKNVENNAGELDQPEYRLAVYARAMWRADQGKRPVVPAAGSAEDLAAHQLADAIYAELAGHDDLFPDDLYATAKRVAGARPLDLSKQPFVVARDGRMDAAFTDAVMTLPGIGYASVPIRSPWGWDIVLVTDILPAQTMTRDELVAKLFPGLRRGYFDQVWSAQLERGHTIEEFPELLADPQDPTEQPPDEPPPGLPGAAP